MYVQVLLVPIGQYLLMWPPLAAKDPGRPLAQWPHAQFRFILLYNEMEFGFGERRSFCDLLHPPTKVDFEAAAIEGMFER